MKRQKPTDDFDREKHIFKVPGYASVVEQAIEFFNSTPVHKLPPPESLIGVGVYALYYVGDFDLYRNLAQVNRRSLRLPIYVGKSVPEGWRKGRSQGANGSKLKARLNDHVKSIASTENLRVVDFRSRFVIFENAETDLISSVESNLIRHYTPLWNSRIEGFGLHDPGKNRYGGKISQWDALHSGRRWYSRLSGTEPDLDQIKVLVQDYMDKLRLP